MNDILSGLAAFWWLIASWRTCQELAAGELRPMPWTQRTVFAFVLWFGAVAALWQISERQAAAADYARLERQIATSIKQAVPLPPYCGVNVTITSDSAEVSFSR